MQEKMFPRRTIVWSIWLAPLIFCACYSSARGEDTPPPIESKFLRERDAAARARETGNAALQYLLAILYLPEPKDDELERFLSDTLLGAPPQILKEHPKAVEAVRGYGKAVTQFFQRGARVKRCTFDSDWRKGIKLPLRHLAKLRDLARRAWAYGKLLEYENKPGEAARVYIDVIRCGVHLGQEPNLINSLVGIAIATMGSNALLDQLARGVDEPTAWLILSDLLSLPDRPMDITSTLEGERVFYGSSVWESIYRQVQKRPPDIKNVGGGLFGIGVDGENMVALWRQAGLPERPAELRRLVAQEEKECHDLMKRISKATREPYYKAAKEIERIEQEAQDIKRAFKKDPVAALKRRPFGWVTTLLVGGLSRSNVSVARLEARLAGLKLLAAASFRKASRGHWPLSLAGVRLRFPKGLPMDPFTGKDFQYRIERGMPTVECQGDDPQKKKLMPHHFIFSLARTRQKEKAVLKRWREEHRAEKQPSTTRRGKRPAVHALETRDAEKSASIRKLLEEKVGEEKLPGMIAAIIDETGVIAIGSAGVRKMGLNTKMGDDDLVHIGSCTKAMTCTMLATLVADGILAWDTTLIDALPELKGSIHAKYHDVTLWQLVTHRAGIPTKATNWWVHGKMEIKKRRLAILKENLASASSLKVGDFHYSNLSYMVAGCMAEKRTGSSWETLMKEQLFEPLGMTSAGFGSPGRVGAVDQPWGHFKKDGKWQSRQFDNAEAFGPAGRVHCTIGDWAKFIALQLPVKSNRFLSRKFLDKLIEPNGAYAGGWYITKRSWAKGITLNHNGSNTMWYTTLWVAPELNRAYVTVTNSKDKSSFTSCDNVVVEVLRIDRRIK